eukprot:359585-Chlamydomonas_euryale.AAC.7
MHAGAGNLQAAPLPSPTLPPRPRPVRRPALYLRRSAVCLVHARVRALSSGIRRAVLLAQVSALKPGPQHALVPHEQARRRQRCSHQQHHAQAAGRGAAAAGAAAESGVAV